MPRRQRLWLIILLVLSAVLAQAGLTPTPVCLAADVAAVQDDGGPDNNQLSLDMDCRLRRQSARVTAPAAPQFIPAVSCRVTNLQIRSSVLTHSPPTHS